MSANNSPSPNVMVQVFPKAGKEARIEELIIQAAEGVRQHEPYISLYHYFKVEKDAFAGASDGPSYTFIRENEFVTLFRIEDTSKLVSRAQMPHLQAIAKAFHDEDLLREPLKYSFLADIGFWVR